MKMLFFLLVFTAFSSFSQEDYKILGQKKGNSSIKLIEDKEYGSGYIINQTVFDMKQFMMDTNDYDGNVNYHLVEKNIEEWRSYGWEKPLIKQDVKIYNLNDLKKPVVSFQKQCDEVYFHDNFFETITYGCCASPDEIGLFTYKNKPILSSQGRVSIINYGDWDLFLGTTVFERNIKPTVKDTVCMFNLYKGSSENWEFLILNSDTLSKLTEFNFPLIEIESVGVVQVPIQTSNYLFDLYYIRLNENEKMNFKLKISFEIENGRDIDQENYFETKTVKTIEIPFYNLRPNGTNKNKYVIDLKDL